MSGDVEGRVVYDEPSASGTLYVASFSQFPPMGPPSGLYQNATPAFPQDFSIIDLDAGSYTLFAFLDIGDNSPQMPGPEDPQGMVMVTVTAGDLAQAPDIMLSFLK
jgi:hypothetical protein